jgi:hypothetical protein
VEDAADQRIGEDRRDVPRIEIALPERDAAEKEPARPTRSAHEGADPTIITSSTLPLFAGSSQPLMTGRRSPTTVEPGGQW